jgi:3-hydroxyisobutyrate dehydrogenase-like beta-hydroxyacid dehydrogenase
MNVAFVGLGEMGQRIAERLIDARHTLHVWNRTAAKADGLVARGATLADSPAAAARAADVVFTMVADPAALEAVTVGPDGVLAGLGDATLVEMSTVGPAAIARLAAKTPLIDSPVLGSLAEAEGGTLKLFVGGDDAAVARVMPLLEVLGTPIHVGATGAGAAAKLVANSTLFAVIAGLGEALALADALGLERVKAFEVVAATALGPTLERRREQIERDEYPPRFKLSLAHKDAGLVVEADPDLRVARAALSWLDDAMHHGFENEDYSVVLRAIMSR